MVNAGPAVFVSATGTNPIMVQVLLFSNLVQIHTHLLKYLVMHS